MTDKEKLEQISLSLEKFQRTGDAEHLKDIERILEYDGLADKKEQHVRKQKTTARTVAYKKIQFHYTTKMRKMNELTLSNNLVQEVAA